MDEGLKQLAPRTHPLCYFVRLLLFLHVAMGFLDVATDDFRML
jgi:hypothetical protein